MKKKIATIGFDYCFWAKMLIAIPIIPLVGVTTAMFFQEPPWQFIMASYSGAVLVILTQQLDRLPLFSQSIIRGDENDL